MSKKLYIKTYGCQMNVYDSVRMAELLKPYGYETTEEPAAADMVILNTCHIREKATEKVYSELGRFRRLKEKRQAMTGEDTIITVAGCVGQAEGEEIFRRAPFVDIVVGPQSYQNLPDLLSRAKREKHAIDLEFPAISKFDNLSEEVSSQGVSALLSVQEGCDKFCTFCVVPYTRGAEYSRPVGDVYREAVQLAAAGTKELILLGQNVNAYHGEAAEGKSWNLGQLIRHLAKLDGIERLRYTTSHPRDMHEELFEAHALEPKLMPFLHLPVQAGSDRTLAAMNRKHTAADYLKIIEKLRKVRPDIQLSSDFIVGFPGETEQDFEDTLALVREVGFVQAYSFKYSPRPGTPGANMDNQVAEEVKAERLARLQALLLEQQLAFNRQCVGQIMPVLFDREGRHEGQLLGKSPFMQSVHIQGAERFAGTITPVRIIEALPNSLAGCMLEEEAKLVA